MASVSGFFSSLFSEVAARRRRLRGAVGQWSQGLFEMLLLGGLVAGSLGLFLQPWMAAASPWGFAVPFVFAAAYALLDARRQNAIARGAQPERVRAWHDWFALGLCVIAAGAGAAAFAIAFAAKPAPPEEPVWTPPSDAVAVDIAPRQ